MPRKGRRFQENDHVNTFYPNLYPLGMGYEMYNCMSPFPSSATYQIYSSSWEDGLHVTDARQRTKTNVL